MRLALVHGFTQTGRSWGPIKDDLERRGHDVVCPDAPGHGAKSAFRADLTAGAEVIGAEVGRAIWVGYSMGGRLCLHLALQKPGLVDGLVLVSTTAGIEDPRARAERQQADNEQADALERNGDVASFVDGWLQGPLWATLPADRAGIEHRLTNTPEGLASSLRLAGTGAQKNLWPDLSGLRMPVLVVTGERDPKFDGIGDRMATAIGPTATRARMPNGHALPWEDPGGFGDVLATWITQLH